MSLSTETARVLPPPPRSEPSDRRQATRRRLLVVFVVLLGAVGFLIYKGLTSAVVYFKTADQAVASRRALGNSTFQIEGTVVPGSVHNQGAKVAAFEISSNGVRVQVDNSGDPPQLFQNNIPVVLVGHFVGGSDVFASDQILVKHTNQYIAAHPNRVRGPNGKVH